MQTIKVYPSVPAFSDPFRYMKQVFCLIDITNQCYKFSYASIGDLWSYNYLKEEFVVSPEPDVSVVKLDPVKDKCLVIGSDGLWNMMSAEESVNMVFDLEYHFELKVINDPVGWENQDVVLK